MSKNFVKYIFIGNADSQKMIGETSLKPNKKWSESSNKIFNQYTNNVENKYGIRNKIQTEEGIFYCTIYKNNIFYLGLFADNYPEKSAFQIIEEIKNDNIHLLTDPKGELNDIGKKTLKEKLINYDTQKPDKLNEINEELDEIKIEMRENVKKAINNNENLSQLDEKAVKIKDNANMFKKEASAVANKTLWNKYKWNLIIGLIIIGILLVIIIPIATGGKKDKRNLYFYNKI
jgi:vesicle-associated membrane protein 7